MKKHAVTEALDSYEDQIRDMRNKQKALRQCRADINARLAPLLVAQDAGWLPYAPTVYAELQWDGTPRFEIYANMAKVDGFTHPALLAVLEAYIDANEVKSDDSAQYRQRTYKFVFEATNLRPQIKVILTVQVREDSPTCTRVLKGVEDVVTKKEVYELVCSDGTTQAA